MSEDNEDKELTKEIEFCEIVCIVCGTTFYIQEELDDLRREDGRDFHCPNGHGQHYKISRQKQLEEAQKELAEAQVANRQLKCALLKQPPEASPPARKSLFKRLLTARLLP